MEEAGAEYRRRFTVEFNMVRCPCLVPVIDRARYLAESAHC